jgi:hypothetical protein
MGLGQFVAANEAICNDKANQYNGSDINTLFPNTENSN